MSLTSEGRAIRARAAHLAAERLTLAAIVALPGGRRQHQKVVRPRWPQAPTYGADVVALRFCWAVLGAPTGKRLAPVMGELVATLRRFGELDVSDQLAGALVVMSPATMDRRLAPDRAAMTLRGRSHTKPGSLLKDAIPIRTWAQWDDAVRGFVEIDLVGHECPHPLRWSPHSKTSSEPRPAQRQPSHRQRVLRRGRVRRTEAGGQGSADALPRAAASTGSVGDG